jgi:hypothetical protein
MEGILMAQMDEYSKVFKEEAYELLTELKQLCLS